MAGSGLVGVAEVAVYTGYLRRVKEAKTKEKKKPEVKEIVGTWVIEPREKKETRLLTPTFGLKNGSLRKRKP